MNQSQSKLNFNATWSMAVGGMVGGKIFSTLGVVVGIVGLRAWLSFAVAGLIAFATGYSYVRLADYYGEGGGAFTFLRETNAGGCRLGPFPVDSADAFLGCAGRRDRRSAVRCNVRIYVS